MQDIQSLFADYASYHQTAGNKTFHRLGIPMIMLTLLALLTTEAEQEEGPWITLSTMTSLEKEPGGDTIKIEPQVEAQFDLPLPSKADLLDDRKREALIAAAQDARDLRLDDDTPNLPDLETIKGRIGRTDGFAAAVAGAERSRAAPERSCGRGSPPSGSSGRPPVAGLRRRGPRAAARSSRGPLSAGY